MSTMRIPEFFAHAKSWNRSSKGESLVQNGVFASRLSKSSEIALES